MCLRRLSLQGDNWTYDQQLDGLLVCDQRWEALCELDAGSWFPTFLETEGLHMIPGKSVEDYHGLRIPTLREVSVWCIDNDVDVILEIKAEKGHEFYTGYCCTINTTIKADKRSFFIICYFRKHCGEIFGTPVDRL